MIPIRKKNCKEMLQNPNRYKIENCTQKIALASKNINFDFTILKLEIQLIRI